MDCPVLVGSAWLSLLRWLRRLPRLARLLGSTPAWRLGGPCWLDSARPGPAQLSSGRLSSTQFRLSSIQAEAHIRVRLRLRLGSAQLRSEQLSSTQAWTQLNSGSGSTSSAQLSSDRHGLAWLGAVHFGSARLGLARLGLAWLGSARITCFPEVTEIHRTVPELD